MGRQSNPITPHETWLELFWSKFDFVLSPVLKYKALVGVLSSSIWVLYQGRIFLAATDRKNITDLFCFERAHFKVFYILFFFHGVCKPCNEPETSGDWTHKFTRRHFCSLPFFVLNILLFNLFTFSYRNFFPLFVCFDILWQLATTPARDNTRDRDANSSRKNDVTWCDTAPQYGTKAGDAKKLSDKWGSTFATSLLHSRSHGGTKILLSRLVRCSLFRHRNPSSQPFLCVNRSLIRYDFHGGAKISTIVWT